MPSAKSQTRRQVDALREPVPAEDPEPEEGRLEHERREPLDRERRAEDVADELRVDDQFIPNWNSWTSPVATPIAKLISISVPKNRVSRSQASSPERYQSVCMTATSGASPSVSGTKRKWYSEVIANWTRASSTVVTATVPISPA